MLTAMARSLVLSICSKFFAYCRFFRWSWSYSKSYMHSNAMKHLNRLWFYVICLRESTFLSLEIRVQYVSIQELHIPRTHPSTMKFAQTSCTLFEPQQQFQYEVCIISSKCPHFIWQPHFSHPFSLSPIPCRARVNEVGCSHAEHERGLKDQQHLIAWHFLHRCLARQSRT